MISVIIPTLNEEENLTRCIASVRENAGDAEILVVDGGSIDGTQNIAARLGAELIFTPARQRAAQLNAGARVARGDLLMFLHADTTVPNCAFARIQEAFSDPKIGGGAFARRFDSPSVFLRITCCLAELRNRSVGWHLGDQAMFVRKAVFEELGGFKLMDRFEDLDFSRRLGANWRMVTVRPCVVTSARRFIKLGPVRQTWNDFWLTISYLRAVSDLTPVKQPATEARRKVQV